MLHILAVDTFDPGHSDDDALEQELSLESSMTLDVHESDSDDFNDTDLSLLP